VSEEPLFSIGLLDETYEDEEDKEQRFYGVTVGQVINLADPMFMGRVQVRMPSLDSLDPIAWARVATPMAGATSGVYLIPNVGDEVLLAFEHGDVNAPYIIGSLWNASSPPPLPNPMPQIRAIRTLAGNQIVFTEAPTTVTIQTGPTPPVSMPAPPSPTGPHTTVMLSPTGVQIASPAGAKILSGSTVVDISPTSVVITSGTNAISMTPEGIRITSGTSVDIKAPLVKINSP